MKPAVFLSYSRKNFPFARDLYRGLAAVGMVWFAVLDVSAGEKYLDAVGYKNLPAFIKSGRSPNADMAIAQASNVIAHMGNHAHRIGNGALRYDTVSGRFDNDRANALVKPEYRKRYEIPDKV